MGYERTSVSAPRLAGWSLGAVATLLESAWGRALVVPKLLESAGIASFREASIEEAPTFVPFADKAPEFAPSTPDDLQPFAQPRRAAGYAFETIADFAAAYRERRVDPVQIAERALAAVDDSNSKSPALRAIVSTQLEDVRAQARASAERHRRGAALGLLDGVPIAVKEEFDVRGYPTTVGTRFLRSVASDDAFAVARLRAAGAVVIGKANMHEIGIDVLGFNAHHGTARNPYDPARYPGGSSSGSAAAVAAGLVPLALSADAGGSIRIPAALCGVVGLKPTFGRVSERGAYPLCWSIAHAGPIGATADDVAIGYSLMAGLDAADPNTHFRPAVDLAGYHHGLDGLRLGIYQPWFEDAAPDVVRLCKDAIARFEARGARVVEIELPDLDLCRVAHGIIALTEMATAMQPHLAEHRRDFGLPVQIMLALGKELTGRDYLRAQRMRTRLIAHAERALARADVIVTPTTARTAPPIPSDALPRGESDLALTTALMQYIHPWNLTGHPAITFPVGYDESGLPVGMQVVGPGWSEALLLRVARVGSEITERRAPRVTYRLLA
jgi:Asp-tRNA(Asn)/Glu-tRNA(Gln) amidotransferase A subunit family amidase